MAKAINQTANLSPIPRALLHVLMIMEASIALKNVKIARNSVANTHLIVSLFPFYTLSDAATDSY